MKDELWFHAMVLHGDEPASKHLGSVQAYGVDGKAIPDGDLAADTPPLAGWRARCCCGWRGAQFYPQAEFLRTGGTNPHDPPPAAVIGDGTSGAHSEWYGHIYEALPELMVHDMLANVRSSTHPDVRAIVGLARGEWGELGADRHGHRPTSEHSRGAVGAAPTASSPTSSVDPAAATGRGAGRIPARVRSATVARPT